MQMRFPKLGLGTVQLGRPYGVTNRAGQPPAAESAAILALAAQSFAYLDTASAYGESERIIGELLDADAPLKIITKSPPLDAEGDIAAQLEEAFLWSLTLLKRPSVYGLLLHREKTLLDHQGARVYQKLQELKQRGLVEKIGVSLYHCPIGDQILESFPLDLVQVPLSVFDQRPITTAALVRWKARGVEIHARSLFLQGVLLENPETLPPFFAPLAAPLAAYYAQLAELGISRLTAALLFGCLQQEVSALIVGVCSLQQGKDISASYAEALRLAQDNAVNFAGFKCEDETFLHPGNWKL